MKNEIVKINNIVKRYGNHLVLDEVTFSVNQSEICGLVGENGAGKTTLIRILAGLIKENSGSIGVSDDLKISCIVESPSLYPNLSAYENLKYQALACGVKNIEEKINETLILVGLDKVDKNKKSKDFSLGMRQRLAIGLAIVDSPNFLILDEPINGLDPMGIKDVRNILKTLKEKYKMTVLISSHILSELDLVADRFIIMSRGKIIENIDSKKLEDNLSKKIVVEVNDTEKCIEILKSNNFSVQKEKDRVELTDTNHTVTDIIDLLRSNLIEINSIYNKKMTFEEYYLNLIKK